MLFEKEGDRGEGEKMTAAGTLFFSGFNKARLCFRRNQRRSVHTNASKLESLPPPAATW